MRPTVGGCASGAQQDDPLEGRNGEPAASAHPATPESSAHCTQRWGDQASLGFGFGAGVAKSLEAVWSLNRSLEK